MLSVLLTTPRKNIAAVITSLHKNDQWFGSLPVGKIYYFAVLLTACSSKLYNIANTGTFNNNIAIEKFNNFSSLYASYESAAPAGLEKLSAYLSQVN